MLGAFPVFVGVVGKREFSSDPARHDALAERVRVRLAAVFDRLDRRLPDVTKVLMTGGAAGSDLVAAAEVLRTGPGGDVRPNWLVLLVLPFRPELFREDFDDLQWRAFERVQADPRVRVEVLPELRALDGTAPDLRRGDFPQDPEARRRHYEQVGLWIADAANVLVAVMPAGERPNRIGGTARVVACRRGARPDAIRAGIVEASDVLAPHPILKRPPEGFVWLVDPEAETARGGLPFRVLPPFRSEAARRQAHGSPVAAGDADRAAQADLAASEAVLEIARSYSRHLREGARRRTPDTADRQAWNCGGDPVAVASDAFRVLRPPGERAANRSAFTFYWLAGLFLLAVLSLDIYTGFAATNPFAILPYVGIVGAIVAVFLLARRGKWQPISEDRRAIREIVRVQIAWWQAGLDERADHVHLQGVDLDLARVREAARNVINAALLACPGRLPRPDWPAVFKPAEPGARESAPGGWVGNQMRYFRTRERQREAQAHVAEALSWTLFIMSCCLALVLSLVLFRDDLRNAAAAWFGAARATPWLLPVLALLGIVALYGTLRARGTLQTDHGELAATLLSAGFGLLGAVILATTVQLAALTIELWQKPAVLGGCLACLFAVMGVVMLAVRRIRSSPNRVNLRASAAGMAAIVLAALAVQIGAAVLAGERAETTALHVTAAFVVFLIAMAGATRFLVDKLAIEAEALSYRDALGWFEHAADLLGELRPGKGDPVADAEARTVVRELGLLALAENEAWLKTRRERPLSPVI